MQAAAFFAPVARIFALFLRAVANFFVIFWLKPFAVVYIITVKQKARCD